MTAFLYIPMPRQEWRIRIIGGRALCSSSGKIIISGDREPNLAAGMNGHMTKPTAPVC